MLTIVVLGASAGGLHPLREFLRASSSEPGVAVVVITHLPLHHDSHLVSLLGNVGTLPVRAAAKDGSKPRKAPRLATPSGRSTSS